MSTIYQYTNISSYRNPKEALKDGDNISSCVYLFTTNRNIYRSSDTAYSCRNNSVPDKEAMYSVKKGTYAAIVTRSYNTTNNSICFKINCGTTTGWVYFATVAGSKPYLINICGGLGFIKSVYNPLNLPDGKWSEVSSYTGLIGTSGSVNGDRLVGGSNSGDLSDKNTNGASTTASGTTSTTTGTTADDNIDYSNALESRTFYPINWTSPTSTNQLHAYDTYNQGVASNGVAVDKIRGVWGMPYQFLPSTDCRLGFESIDSDDNLSTNVNYAGYEFADKIISRMPLLYLIPGNVAFLASVSENEHKSLMTNVMEFFKTDDSSALEKLTEGYAGKLYTIEPAYAEYFKYVNPMCRAGALFLGIGNEELDGVSLENYHWGLNEGQSYEFYVEETDEEEEEEEKPEETEEEKEEEEEPYVSTFKLTDQLESIQKIIYATNAIPFYINSDVSFTDSFGNETTESTLASTINGLSDKAREIQFLMGTASAAVGSSFDKVDGTLTNIKESIESIVNRISSGNNIFATITRSMKTIISGGRLLFPNIWSNSSFSKSYNISIKLTTPSFDKKSWYLNIYVPLCHLMALCLPRSEYTNSYTTPFLVRGFYKGMFNIDMGIITEMSFQKGKDGGWTKDGLPTVVEVSFTIQDLYSALSMTSEGNMYKGITLQNISELDYIANLCGVNINEPDTWRMIDFWITFNIKNKILDFVPDLKMDLQNAITNKIEKLYTNLWF